MPNIHSFIAQGSRNMPIENKCKLSNGLTTLIIISLGAKAVNETKNRILPARTFVYRRSESK